MERLFPLTHSEKRDRLPCPLAAQYLASKRYGADSAACPRFAQTR
jgi:hypothetical protein